MLSTRHTQINTVRVRGAREDIPELRLTLSSLLNTAELRPIGVPPSAVLVIRHIDEPLSPLVLRRNTVRVDTAWERQIQTALTEIYRRAARPTSCVPPPDADAVVFADESEMLACLAVDVGEGSAQRRWWWGVVLRTVPARSSEGLKTVLCRQPRHLPAVLHHLAGWDKARVVLHVLSPAHAITVLSAMRQTYDLPDFTMDHLPPKDDSRTVASGQSGGDTLHGNPPMGQRRPGDTAQSTSAGVDVPRQPRRSGQTRVPTALQGDVLEPAVNPPWEQWLSSTPALRRLGKERLCLLGVGLALYHAPTAVKTPEFHQAVSAWWRDSPARPDGMLTPSSQEAEQTDPPSEGRAWEDTIAKAEEISSQEGALIKAPGEEAEDRITTLLHTGSQDGIPGSVDSVQQSDTTVPSALDDRNTPPDINPDHDVPYDKAESPLMRQEGIEEARRMGQIQQERNEAPSTKAKVNFGEGAETQLGGVLYLINMMRHLDLPYCFEVDYGLASQVGTWGTLELIGRGLLGGEYGHLAEDPLWDALAELGGREPGTLPGASFDSGDSLRLPENWLNGNRASPSLDVIAPTRPTDEVALLSGLNANLSRWLSRVLPYLRFWLQNALGEGRDIVETLLLHRGMLYVTSSHVDLVMDLDDISLPVRLSGLDRDPGWLRDFGRVVLFHFE